MLFPVLPLDFVGLLTFFPMPPPISIITVVYNNARTLEEAILSVAAQDYPDIEYLVIDGGSTDGTLDIIGKYPDVISHWVSEPDKGIYDAMNKGIRMATGAVIGLLNSDDCYTHSQVISQVMGQFENLETDAVYGDLTYVSEDGSQVIRYWKAGPPKPRNFFWGWMPPHPAFFVRKSLYDTYGLFRLDLKIAADYEMMLRLVEKHHIRLCYLPQVLVRMRVGGASDGSLRHRWKIMQEDWRSWKVNSLRPYFFTLWLKVLRKLPQFFQRPSFLQ